MKLQQLTLVALLTLAITACKKDDPVTPTPSDPTPTTAAVKVNYTFVNGTSAFDPNVTFDDGQGNAVRITKLKFYSHDMHLTDDDDNTVAEFHDDIMLVDALNATNEFELGTMTPGHVHNVAFELGLDSASSYGYPDQMTAPAPLDDNDMTWSWNTAAGRMFVKFEGFVDANGNNTMDMGEMFQYHSIGAAMMPMHAHMHIHGDVAAGSTFNIALKVDVLALVNGLNLSGMFHDDGAENQQLLQNLMVATTPL